MSTVMSATAIQDAMRQHGISATVLKDELIEKSEINKKAIAHEFVCKYGCGYSHLDSQGLRSHERSCTLNPSPLKAKRPCVICGATTAFASRRHERSCKGDPYVTLKKAAAKRLNKIRRELGEQAFKKALWEHGRKPEEVGNGKRWNLMIEIPEEIQGRVSKKNKPFIANPIQKNVKTEKATPKANVALVASFAKASAFEQVIKIMDENILPTAEYSKFRIWEALTKEMLGA